MSSIDFAIMRWTASVACIPCLRSSRLWLRRSSSSLIFI